MRRSLMTELRCALAEWLLSVALRVMPANSLEGVALAGALVAYYGNRKPVESA